MGAQAGRDAQLQKSWRRHKGLQCLCRVLSEILGPAAGPLSQKGLRYYLLRADMEDFSQSRGDDDLFDDEIVPMDTPPSPEKVTAQLEQVSLESQPSPPPAVIPPSDSSPPPVKGRGRGRGGHVRGGVKKNGLTDSKFAPKPKEAAATETVTTKETSSSAQEKTSLPGSENIESPIKPAEETTVNAPPTGPAHSRPPAVKGDRTATGGVRKPKLTEEELSAKLAAAKERSQSLAAAHARAQADAASFEERERIAKEKREKDNLERRAMDSEREKNRQRKMAVMGGREWDAEKKEEDFRIPRGGRGGRRSHAGPDGAEADADDLGMYEWHEDRGRGRARGRGRGRGGRGRAGGGRGAGNPAQRQPDITADAEFPPLPMSEKNGGEVKSTPTVAAKRTDSSSPSDNGGGGLGGSSWAEQVESSEAAKT